MDFFFTFFFFNIYLSLSPSVSMTVCMQIHVYGHLSCLFMGLRVCWTVQNIMHFDALTALFYHLVRDVASHQEGSFGVVEFSRTVSLSLEISVSRYFLSGCVRNRFRFPRLKHILSPGQLFYTAQFL